MQEKETHIVGTQRVYELSVLFVPELDAPALSQAVADLKTELTRLEANIITENTPVHMKLAYTVEKHINNKIKKVNFAHFYFVKFEMEGGNVAALNKFMDLKMNEISMRHLLIKTVKENTFLTELNEAKIADIKNEELINEVLGTEIKDSAEEDAITDLGGDTPLEKPELVEGEEEIEAK